ncbi:hypothetical protein RA812_004230 [Vibrio vulnificus]|nr:hypothetical protein [Vibrio vulnificus]EHV9838356.1 hypothetical protein [Vibrio vulnificus]ELF6474308.1 hypothetical protein [Vibrio vulnificus]HAS8434263.1 hypothetical protein [Vibrio vulnificus]HAS8438760.1 hypothetical protein [Vibrio vulnificus]
MFIAIKRLTRKAWFLGMVLFTTQPASQAFAYEQGSYPSLSNIVYNRSHAYTSAVEEAIEQGHSIPLTFSSAFKSLATVYFSEPFFNAYEAEKMASHSFINNMQGIVKEFACAEFRYRNGLPESNGCNGYIRNKENVEKMPFVDGQYTRHHIEKNIDNYKTKHSIQMYLASSNSIPLNTLFSSVKQMGTFFGSAFDRRDLILSVRMYAYKIDNDGVRYNEPINEKPLVYMIVIPSSVKIASQPNQTQAAKFAIDNAKLLVLP